MKLLAVLTQYKRSYLEQQLIQINNQSLKPDYLVVFQNENHVDISDLKKKYNFIHIKSDYNTKFFGRFAACFTFPVDLCIVMDDDIIPGTDCFKNYVNQCIKLNGIIGGNGRIAQNNAKKNYLKKPREIGNRSESILVDFVGHLWCFKKEWLHYMFALKPYTYDTGEDMHFSFSSKLLGNIKSYTGKQEYPNENCDISYSKYAVDKHASCRAMNKTNIRSDVEKYFIDNYNMEFIKEN